MDKNYYDLLWVQKSSTIDEIKKAYRKKAMEHHPDRWWDTEKFKDINEAYSVLWDDNKRKEYDTYGRVWWWNPFGWNWWFSWGFDVDLWDIFEQFFTWWWWSRNKKRDNSIIPWENLEYVIEIDLKTSITWWKQTISYYKYIICDDCHGEWWSWKTTCRDCWWTWHKVHRQQTMFWTIQQTVVCPSCNGTWEKIEKICQKCNWQKRVKIKKDYELEIPAWIDNGMVIKITWEWNEGIKYSSWDLYIKFIIINKEKNLLRKDYDLYYNLEIDVIEAILWTTKEINIPIIWKRNIKIESWTQIWTTIKLSWDWVKYIDKDKKWDLFINLNIIIPKNITDNQRECYEKIAKEKNINLKAKKWILDKLFD